jgi:hypothetical protein
MRSLAVWGIVLSFLAAVILLIDNLCFAVQPGYGNSYPYPRLDRLFKWAGLGLLIIATVLQVIAAWS